VFATKNCLVALGDISKEESLLIQDDKTLVFGSKSFLAKAFTKKMIENNLSLIEVCREDFDFLDFEALTTHLSRLDFNRIFFSSGPTPCKSLSDFCQNVEILQNLLEYLRVQGIEPKFTYLSSDAVYGPDQSEYLDENSSLNPQTLHGTMHFVREEMLKFFMRKKLLIIRPCAVFGKDDPHSSYGPNKFLKSLHSNTAIELFAGGLDRRDHIWIEDFAEAAVNLHRKEFGIYNLVSGNSRSFKDIVDLINQYSKVQLKFQYVDHERRTTSISYNSKKLEESLGYSLRDSLERGISYILKHHNMESDEN
jgi:nucleoside-diphosphate-sugar epimerase